MALEEIYKELEELCPPDTIFASNTSGLSITEMASATKRASKFIGMHFFNPVPAHETGGTLCFLTSNETYDTCRGFVEKLGKTPIGNQGSPGVFGQSHPLPRTVQRSNFCLG